MFEAFRDYFANTPTGELVWLAIGFAAQLMFSARFLVQWIASERAKASVMPVAFWYFSLAGGLMLFAYAVYRMDPVFIMGQSFGVVVYSRNLWLSGPTSRAHFHQSRRCAFKLKRSSPLFIKAFRLGSSRTNQTRLRLI